MHSQLFLSQPCTTVRGVVSILVYQIALPGDNEQGMPRVYLKGLSCARGSVPVFHPGAEAMQESHSWMRINECPARASYREEVRWVCFVFFGRHLAFCFHLFSNMWE